MKDEDFADGIYWILDAINFVEGGGYDVSTGIDYRNDTFETRSFWAHAEDECSCGVDEWQDEVDRQTRERMKKHPPAKDEDEWDSEWWRLYNLEYGNVTQGENRTHSESCEMDLPGFHHFESGLKVRWYKRVGRSTESNIDMKPIDWYRIVVGCLESVKADYERRTK